MSDTDYFIEPNMPWLRELERARRERDEALKRIDDLEARARACPACDRLARAEKERDEARAEVERLQGVLEAARCFVVSHESRTKWLLDSAKAYDELVTAVAAYDEGQ